MVNSENPQGPSNSSEQSTDSADSDSHEEGKYVQASMGPLARVVERVRILMFE